MWKSEQIAVVLTMIEVKDNLYPVKVGHFQANKASARCVSLVTDSDVDRHTQVGGNDIMRRQTCS
jgi:hypothetical protein